MSATNVNAFEAGKAACKASHGALADRWQEIGRQQCEATHDDLAGSFFDSGYDAGHADGRRQGAVLGLGVAFALAVVAGYLGRRFR